MYKFYVVYLQVCNSFFYLFRWVDNKFNFVRVQLMNFTIMIQKFESEKVFQVPPPLKYRFYEFAEHRTKPHDSSFGGSFGGD